MNKKISKVFLLIYPKKKNEDAIISREEFILAIFYFALLKFPF